MSTKTSTDQLAQAAAATNGPLAGYDASHAYKFVEDAILECNADADTDGLPQIHIEEDFSAGEVARIVDRLWSNPPQGPDPARTRAAMAVMGLHAAAKDKPADRDARSQLLGAKKVFDAITGADMARGVSEWYEPSWDEDDEAITSTVYAAEYLNAEMIAWVRWSNTEHDRS